MSRWSPVSVSRRNVSEPMRRCSRELEAMGFLCRHEKRGTKPTYTVVEWPGRGLLFEQASDVELLAFVAGLRVAVKFGLTYVPETWSPLDPHERLDSVGNGSLSHACPLTSSPSP